MVLRLSHGDVGHFGYTVGPSVHDDSRAVCGKYYLHVGVQLQNNVDEPLLPVDVQAHLGLVHEQYVAAVVLHQHCEEYGEHLFLAARELIRSQRLTYLREQNLVLSALYLLAGAGKQIVNKVLESLLGSRNLARLLSRVGIAALQNGNHTVAYVHLIVKILALQLVELHVEFGGERRDARVELAQCLDVEQRPVHRPDDVVAYPSGILGHNLYFHALEHVVGELASRGKPAHHFVEYGTLSHSVNAA